MGTTPTGILMKLAAAVTTAKRAARASIRVFPPMVIRSNRKLNFHFGLRYHVSRHL